MTTRIAVGVIVMTIVLAIPVHAGGKRELQKYFNDTANKVKATAEPSEKRRILGESFRTMSTALDLIQNSPSIAKDGNQGIDQFRASLQEKQDELAGNNGFVQVPDEQLNEFSDYVVQDMEQAAEVITISVVTLLLIIILIVLLV